MSAAWRTRALAAKFCRSITARQQRRALTDAFSLSAVFSRSGRSFAIAAKSFCSASAQLAPASKSAMIAVALLCDIAPEEASEFTSGPDAARASRNDLIALLLPHANPDAL